MRSGDFTNDAFGNPITGMAIANPNMVGAADPYFQCDSSGHPIPANPDGSQAKGTDCSKIPANLINSVGQGMIDIYPTPNANNAALGYNFVNEPVRQLNGNQNLTSGSTKCSAGPTISSHGSANDQAFSFVPGGAPGLAESNAFRQQ